MPQPDVYLTWPSTFRIFPENLPPTLPPPIHEGTFRSPFGIDKDLFNAALRPEIPFTFAAVYILAVFSLNAYNSNSRNQPWRISKSGAFKYFVILHNALLAVYSFATFLAMFRAISHTWPDLAGAGPEWKPKIADALCKLHGPRGLGDATTFNTTINIWEAKNTAIHMGANGNPDPTDVGRLWNEGLAFWGWMFYVSKFYEVIDTGIILAKGKRSAPLQTYHHAGAMLCMWAGIRYMSPPIWMFVFINSGIHAMMYTYYTLGTLNIRVPQTLKRALTVMQIAQFIWGASYAAAHLFVKYDIPISTPFQVVHSVERVASAVSAAPSSASSFISAASSAVSAFAESPTVTGTMAAYIKKLLLRAAGEEGVAERVGLQRNQDVLAAAPAKMEEKIHHFMEHRYETKYRTDWTQVKCVDTSGEAFAIYLNLLYLAPLTWLFLRFFVRAYSRRRSVSGKSRTASQAARDVADSMKDAHRKTSESFDNAGKEAEDELSMRSSQAEEELRKDIKAVRDGSWREKERKVSEKISDQFQTFEKGAKDLADTAKNAINGSGSPRKASPKKAPTEDLMELAENVKAEASQSESVIEEKTPTSAKPKSQNKSAKSQSSQGDTKTGETTSSTTETTSSQSQSTSTTTDNNDRKPSPHPKTNPKPLVPTPTTPTPWARAALSCKSPPKPRPKPSLPHPQAPTTDPAAASSKKALPPPAVVPPNHDKSLSIATKALTRRSK